MISFFIIYQIQLEAERLLSNSLSHSIMVTVSSMAVLSSGLNKIKEKGPRTKLVIDIGSQISSEQDFIAEIQ